VYYQRINGIIAGAEEDAAGSATGDATGDVADDVSNATAKFALMGISSQKFNTKNVISRFKHIKVHYKL
ncbi:hypothetical protein Tco_0416182, partial [Tanacetum coccineum]